MVGHGCAPSARPHQVLRPPGGLSPGPAIEERESNAAAVQRISVLVGLTRDQAVDKVVDLGLWIQDPSAEAVTPEFNPDRLWLEVVNDRVVAVTLG
jgi:hypothetical protein